MISNKQVGIQSLRQGCPIGGPRAGWGPQPTFMWPLKA